MNMKDIAKLAGVSPSTVSKVINNKDQNISKQTRKKVMEVVNRYQYTPFSKALARSGARTRLVGVLLPNLADTYHAHILRGLENALSRQGYNLILCNTDGRAAEESAAFQLLRLRRVECVAVLGKLHNQELGDTIAASGIPCLDLDAENSIRNSVQIFFDLQQSVAALVEHFLAMQHGKIALILKKNNHRFRHCFRQEMQQHNRYYDSSLVFAVDPHSAELEEALDVLLHAGVRAVLVDGISIAQGVYTYAAFKHLRVGEDFSIAALDDHAAAATMRPSLTCIRYPFDAFGDAAVQAAVRMMEEKSLSSNAIPVPVTLVKRNSVQRMAPDNRNRIVVVGSMNMDVMLEVEHLPRAGETVIIGGKTILPGGKGANQAIGAARLGAKVDMIGRLGNDVYGKELYHNFYTAGVGVQGVEFDNKYDTGRAYIYITDDAQYSIGVHAGANLQLDKEQIEKYQKEILRASYCLVQTEISMDTVVYLGELCKKNNVRVILKPSPAKTLPDKLLKNLYMLVPNQTELNQMLPGAGSAEEKVAALLRRGVSHVILTLGKDGCYHSDGRTGTYYPAATVNVVDTTGASDAFISALAAYLSAEHSIPQAIEFANIAAGISITRLGVQSALPDRKAVGMMYRGYPAQLHP